MDVPTLSMFYDVPLSAYVSEDLEFEPLERGSASLDAERLAADRRLAKGGMITLGVGVGVAAGSLFARSGEGFFVGLGAVALGAGLTGIGSVGAAHQLGRSAFSGACAGALAVGGIVGMGSVLLGVGGQGWLPPGLVYGVGFTIASIPFALAAYGVARSDPKIAVQWVPTPSGVAVAGRW